MSDPTDTNNDPITLANVDDYLHHQDLFLPHDDDQGPTPHEIDAAITNASNSMLEEHNSSSLEQAAGHHGHNDLDTSHHDHDENGHAIDPSLMDDLQHQQGQDDSDNQNNAQAASSSRASNPKNHTLPYKRRILSEDAVHNPSTNLAPFIKPQRQEDSPHPEQIYFAARDDFEEWLKGESSWCHYVQRRVTNPEKRADERLKARIRAHERALAGKLMDLFLPKVSLLTSDSYGSRSTSIGSTPKTSAKESYIGSQGKSHIYMSSRRYLLVQAL